MVTPQRQVVRHLPSQHHHFWCAVARTNAVKSLSDEVVFSLSESKYTVSARFQNVQRVQKLQAKNLRCTAEK